MTAARLKAAPADGHGLTSSINDGIYKMRQRGEPTGDIVAIVILRPVGTFERDTAKGRHSGVNYEAIRVEPVRDSGLSGFTADELRKAAEEAYQNRTSHGIRTLPMDFDNLPDEERRLELIEAIDDWAGAEGLTGKEVEDKWVDYHGIGHGGTAAKDYHKASTTQLLEFAHAVDAVTDKPVSDASDDESLGDDGDGSDE